MTNVQIFNSINIETPFEAIYKRLGFRHDTTKISVPETEKFNKNIQEALNYIRLRGAAVRIPIKDKNDEMTFLSTGGAFKSKLVAGLLKDACEILLIAATSGRAIMKAIEKFQKEDMTKSVVFDAVASETTDAALEWIISYFKTGLCRENKQLTSKRVSCGYADFELSYQLKIYELLKLKQLDIDITDGCMLIPEKSVTALTGIITK